MCLWNPFLHTYNYDYERVTINGSQVQYEEDGSWLIVVAASDPGHRNWVSTAGHRRGRIWFRWFLPEHDAGATERQGRDVRDVPADREVTVRPGPVVIDDLAEPRFSDEVRSVMALMAEAGAGLELERRGAHGGGGRADRPRRIR